MTRTTLFLAVLTVAALSVAVPERAAADTRPGKRIAFTLRPPKELRCRF